jgi:hypothetical protein
MPKEPDMLEITKIKIKLDKREIELSADEARKIYEELKTLFFNAERTETTELLQKLKEMENNKQYIPYPIYIDRWSPPARPYWGYDIITCGTNSAEYPTNMNGLLSINLTSNQYKSTAKT